MGGDVYEATSETTPPIILVSQRPLFSLAFIKRMNSLTLLLHGKRSEVGEKDIERVLALWDWVLSQVLKASPFLCMDGAGLRYQGNAFWSVSIGARENDVRMEPPCYKRYTLNICS